MLSQKMQKDINSISFFDGHFYKLVPTCGYPTLQIDGIQMHRVKEITPEKDAELKVKKLRVKKGDRVLDICTGLGYTAIFLVQSGALVTTIESDENVIRIAKLNPHSKPLFEMEEHGEIELIFGDACKKVKNFVDNSFDCVLHDPPRYGLAEKLYSEKFYSELYRILKPNGKLFHYVGTPGSKYRKVNLLGKVKGHLKIVGFKEIVWDNETLGILAIK